MGITVPPAETAFLLHHVIGFDAMREADTLAVLEESTRLAEDTGSNAASSSVSGRPWPPKSGLAEMPIQPPAA